MFHRGPPRPADSGRVSKEKAIVTCTECGFEWFGPIAAHALRTIGSCTHCRGELRFDDEPALPTIAEQVLDAPAHLVLGTPRL
jgi:hypothetical protein